MGRRSNGTSLSIDKNRHDEIVEAKTVITSLWEIEDMFALFAKAFLDLEGYMLRLALEYNYNFDALTNVDDLFDNARQEINLKLIAFLTAAHSYREQMEKFTSNLPCLETCGKEVEASIKKVFDGSLEYRVMYALRNHALHKGTQIGKVSLGSQNQYPPGQPIATAPSRLRVSVDPRIEIRDFIANPKNRKATSKELKDLAVKNLDLKFFVRGYVEGLFQIHKAMREHSQAVLDQALDCLQQASKDLQEIKGSAPDYVHVCRKLAENDLEWISADYTLCSRVTQIRRSWTRLENAQRAYISSEISMDKNTHPQEHHRIWIPK